MRKKPVPATTEGAWQEMVDAGYEPLEPYPGRSNVTWRSRCLECGAERLASLWAVRSGSRCKHRRHPVAITPDGAEAEMRAAGYEPQGPYPGAADEPWPSICLTCGVERRANLSAIRQGKRCQHRQAEMRPVTPATAYELLHAAGWQELEVYPGTPKKVWRVKCVHCGRVARVSIRAIRAGRPPCRHAREGTQRSAEEAETVLRGAGFEPVVPYPGNETTPWLMLCKTCNRAWSPQLREVATGKKCLHTYDGVKKIELKRLRRGTS